MVKNGKECQSGDTGSIPGSEKSPGERNDNPLQYSCVSCISSWILYHHTTWEAPLQYSCLGNPMDRGAWQAKVHGVTKSQTANKKQQQQQTKHSKIIIFIQMTKYKYHKDGVLICSCIGAPVN